MSLRRLRLITLSTCWFTHFTSFYSNVLLQCAFNQLIKAAGSQVASASCEAEVIAPQAVFPYDRFQQGEAKSEERYDTDDTLQQLYIRGNLVAQVSISN